MNEQEFDNLWQEAEIKELAHRMVQGYPAWAQRRKRRQNGIMAGLAIGVVAAFTPGLWHPSVNDNYITVCCNRTNIDDSQWVDLASEMLANDIMI